MRDIRIRRNIWFRFINVLYIKDNMFFNRFSTLRSETLRMRSHYFH